MAGVPKAAAGSGPKMDFKEMKSEPKVPAVDFKEMKGSIMEVLDPNMYGLVVGLLVGLLTLLLVWWWTSRKRLGREVLLCGTCDSGKTTLLAQLVAGKPVETYSSMKENLQSLSTEGKPALQLVDVPGSERIRGEILERYGSGSRGILFVVDSSTVTKQVRDVTEYLHSILSLPAIAANSPPLMVLCNKQDLDLAKTSGLIRTALEKEMDKVRLSRGNQLGGLEGGASNSVFIGKEGKSFEFSHLKCRVEFCEGSSQDLDSLAPLQQWLGQIA